METISIQIPVVVFPDIEKLGESDVSDALLLKSAIDATAVAYAPYSAFRVGAALRLANGKMLTGSNQENASFPAGLCAERVVLSAASAVYPGVAIEALAVSYMPETGFSERPISPCGICRQTLAEYEQRFQHPIRLILGGFSGEIFIIQRATDLLPLAFSSQELTGR